jgi:hypothetical protein
MPGYISQVMNFRFHIGKATEAACLFLERGGGQMNIMKLVKLLYLLDRCSLELVCMAIGKSLAQLNRLRQEAIQLNRH